MRASRHYEGMRKHAAAAGLRIDKAVPAPQLEQTFATVPCPPQLIRCHGCLCCSVVPAAPGGSRGAGAETAASVEAMNGVTASVTPVALAYSVADRCHSRT